MRDRQNDLFTPDKSSGAAPPVISPQAIKQRLSWLQWAGLAAAVYATVGEVVLPEPLRLSTFIGLRAGQIGAIITRTQAPEQARAVCLQSREQSAQQAYLKCLSEPYATGPKCDAARRLQRITACD